MRNILIFILISTSFIVRAQDPQFSQFYAISSYSNPAMAGNIENMRFELQHRRQWLGMDGSFTTTLAGIESYKKSISSGFALVYMQDLQSSSTFTTNTIHAMYSRQLKLGYKKYLRLGIDAAYQNEKFDKSNLKFVNQYTNAGLISGSSGEPVNQLATGYPTFGAGAVFSGSSYYIGAAVHNINQPVKSFYKGQKESKLPMNININGGYNFNVFSKSGGFEGKPYRAGGIAPSATITAAFNFKKQGDAEQFDAGVYANYFPMTLGIWYRGLPIGSVADGSNNNDALIFIVGINIDRIKVGYSYDFTISDLFGTSQGSHEITLIYDIPGKARGTKKSGWSSPPVSCPLF